MKIEVHFRDELIGTITSTGAKLAWEGKPHQLESIARYYQRQGYEGDELLKRMLERLQGNWWARLVEE